MLNRGPVSAAHAFHGGRSTFMSEQIAAGKPSDADPRFSAPQVSLPKGGGAIRGIGEKFAANPVTGTGSLSVPIAVPPGRSGFAPQLSLSYDSGSGNGPFGFGWSLSLASITRKTDKGLPRYDDTEESDVFLLSGAEDLVPVLEEQAGVWTRAAIDRTVDGVAYRVHRYRPRTEGLFARIERWKVVGTGETHWRSITRDNVTTLYGRDNGSRVFDPADPALPRPTRVFQWLACESHDGRGNSIVYDYLAENSDGVDLTQAHERNRTGASRGANRYIKRIRYGNTVSTLAPPAGAAQPEWRFEVVFDYGDHDALAPAPASTETWHCRRDPHSSCRAGFEVRGYRLCQRVLSFHHFPGEQGVGADCLVHSTDLAYHDAGTAPADRGRGRPEASFIVSVTQCGYRRKGGGYRKRSLPPLEFTYSEAVIQDGVRELDRTSRENLPRGVDGAAFQWVDLDGEGLSGILSEQAHAWLYKRNLGDGRFGPAETLATRPVTAALGAGPQLLDLAGDGRMDLADFGGPTPGFWERTDDGGWEPFRAFVAVPKLSWGDPNLKFVDLDGDGHADVLVTEGDSLVWYPSRAEEGFDAPRCVRLPVDDEERGPRLVFADGTGSAYLADMSGDGLADLVRVRNGEVCYWPGLGHGRFGARVSMDGSPWFDAPDHFDARRLRVADLDGSGSTDLVYLAADGVRLYFNQCGNRFAEPRRLSFPRVDDASTVVVVDLLGTGTACLVWSSPLAGDGGRPLRYVELMAEKPHLLTRVRNNLGAETAVRYAPSTRFYLADRAAGRPWVTRLPFPVHVVERVETYDRVSRNRFVARYAYHHGFFDGAEREFRGFGMVEQWDTEEMGALSGAAFPADGVEATSQVPPVLTRTWFHTGAFFEAGSIARRFAAEYWREGDASLADAGLSETAAGALLLPDTVLPSTLLRASGTRVARTLTGEEAREACRALRGSVLRQEVYALDGSEAQDRPYSVSERGYAVELLQPREGNPHAVFLAHAAETVDLHYERALYTVNGARRADPRVSHALTLEVDGWGNVLRSAQAVYGRRFPDPALDAKDRAKQAAIHVTLTENAFTNAVVDPLHPDDHRAPMPWETRTYELLNVAPTAAPATAVPLKTLLFTLTELRGAATTVADGAHEVPYEDPAAPIVATGARCRRLIEHIRTLYRADDLSAALAPGVAQARGLPFESYKLAFTPGLLATVYHRTRGGVDEDLLPDPSAVLGGEGGYVQGTDGGWWIPSGQARYSPGDGDSATQEVAHALEHFFLPHRFVDPFGNRTHVAYDAYDLLVTETRDAVGNTVTAENDYRVLQPAMVTDPNGNRTAAAFDALGMVVATAVMGKAAGPAEGDFLDGFDPDLPQGAPLQYPFADPHALLGRATTRLVYDLFAYLNTPANQSPRPAAVCTLARETHVAELAPGETSKVQQGFAFSDGFGREIQKKMQAEPGPLAEGGPDVAPRWVGSGWAVFNNKGKPVRKYEPFFSATATFEFAHSVGVSPVLFYDPVERVVATLHPNHTWEKVVFDPWRQESWDVNDTVVLEPQADADVGGFFAPPADLDLVDVLNPLPATEYLPTWHQLHDGGLLGTWEGDAAKKAVVHAGTPTVAFFDTLGRTFLTIAHNHFQHSHPQAVPVDEKHETRVAFDIEGNEREVTDALGRVVMRYDYDMLGSRVRQASMEAGTRWVLNDAAGKGIRGWDSRGHALRTTYDALRRPTAVFVDYGAGERAAERTEYGEGAPGDVQRNLRGKAFRVFDGAGVATSEAYDFKGALTRATRRLLADYRAEVDWAASPALEEELFTTTTRHDALGRVTQQVAPFSDRPGATLSIVQPAYNDANLLERMDAWLDQPAEPAALLDPATASLGAVTGLAYNARGQRTEIAYGNGTVTRYWYDPLTFRLTRLATTRGTAFPADCPEPPDAVHPSCGVQNLAYFYDPAGNITHVEDAAQQTVFFRNQRVEPSSSYTYDSLYRLIEATGREHLGQSAGGSPLPPVPGSDTDAPRVDLLHPGDGNAMGRYLERYVYDAVGNFLRMIHRAQYPAQRGWRRKYTYAEPSLLEPGKVSNRLTSTLVGAGSAETYAHDEHGNLTAMPHLSLMRWDHADRLRATARQAIAHGGVPETTWYTYDAAGERVRKVTDAAAAAGGGGPPRRTKERIYLGGLEIYREYAPDGATITLERETLHLMDDKQRVAMVETRTQGSDPSPGRLIRYQLSNHLGSACLELDDSAQVISYEEYYPYGSTSYQAVRSQTETPKRYRYTGKERDEETGLAYHGARYYAAWLGRWTRADPIGVQDGPNLYAYVRSAPLKHVDKHGMQAETAMNEEEPPSIFNSTPTPATRKRAEYKVAVISVLQQELDKPAVNYRPNSDRLSPYTKRDRSAILESYLAKELAAVGTYSYWKSNEYRWFGSVSDYEVGIDIYGVRFPTGTESQYHFTNLPATGKLESAYPELFFVPELDAAKEIGALLSASKHAAKLLPITRALGYVKLSVSEKGISSGLKFGIIHVSSSTWNNEWKLGINISEKVKVEMSESKIGISVTDKGVKVEVKENMKDKAVEVSAKIAPSQKPVKQKILP
jgi:RHS repeat-associated protein